MECAPFCKVSTLLGRSIAETSKTRGTSVQVSQIAEGHDSKIANMWNTSSEVLDANTAIYTSVKDISRVLNESEMDAVIIDVLLSSDFSFYVSLDVKMRICLNIDIAEFHQAASMLKKLTSPIFFR